MRKKKKNVSLLRTMIDFVTTTEYYAGFLVFPPTDFFFSFVLKIWIFKLKNEKQIPKLLKAIR
jgi:hypothetical protein